MLQKNLHNRRLPSFITGITKMVDIESLFFIRNKYIFDENVDLNAIHNDWLEIGNDLNRTHQDFVVNKQEGKLLDGQKA